MCSVLPVQRVYPWHSKRLSREERGEKLYELIGRYSKVYSVRAWEACELYRMYKGDTVGRRANAPLEAADSEYEAIFDSEVKQLLNIAKDLVDTAVSKLTKENNKPQVVVTDGDWESRRKARLIDRLIEGQMHHRQGKHKNMWAVFEHALRIALAATRTAAVKITADRDSGKVRAEVHDTLSMVLDVTNAVYDEPTWLAEVQSWDPSQLIDVVGEEYEDAIWGAAERIDEYSDSVSSGRDIGMGLESMDEDFRLTRGAETFRVRVIEGWKFKRGKEPGRHTIAIDGSTLVDEDYMYEDSPFVFIGGVRQLTGQWHQTLTRQVAPVICRVQELLEEIDETMDRANKRTMFYDPEVHSKEDLSTTDDTVLVPVAGLATGIKPPVTELPQPYHPQVLEHVQFLLGHCYGLTGINQFNTAGQIAGDWSGVALRLMKDQLIERFSSPQKDFIEGSVVEAGKKIIRAMLEVLESGEDGELQEGEEPSKSLNTTWKGEGFIRQIDASVLRALDDLEYELDLYAVSQSKSTPEDMMQLFQDLAKMGLVKGEHLLEMKRTMDLEGIAGTPSEAQRNNIEQQIDSWLYDEPSEMKSPGWYQGPLPVFDPAAAIVQVASAWIDAATDRVSPDRLVFFERFVADCQALLEKKSAGQAGMAGAGVQPGPATPVQGAAGPMGAPSGPAPPGAGAPPTGAPPGAPPPPPMA